MPVAQYLEAREGEKPLGVYALYDASRNLQYVGYGRNIILAVKVGPSVLLRGMGSSFWGTPCSTAPSAFSH